MSPAHCDPSCISFPTPTSSYRLPNRSYLWHRRPPSSPHNLAQFLSTFSTAQHLQSRSYVFYRAYHSTPHHRALSFSAAFRSSRAIALTSFLTLAPVHHHQSCSYFLPSCLPLVTPKLAHKLFNPPTGRSANISLIFWNPGCRWSPSIFLIFLQSAYHSFLSLVLFLPTRLPHIPSYLAQFFLRLPIITAILLIFSSFALRSTQPSCFFFILTLALTLSSFPSHSPHHRPAPARSPSHLLAPPIFRVLICNLWAANQRSFILFFFWSARGPNLLKQPTTHTTTYKPRPIHLIFNTVAATAVVRAARVYNCFIQFFPAALKSLLCL